MQLALLVWLVLSVPVALLVSRVLRVSREQMERQVRQERQDRLARLARPVSKENRGPLVPQEWQVLRQPGSSAPPGSAQTN